MLARISTAALTLAVVFGSAQTARADVQLSIRDGKVTLIASGATLREILGEWQRVGQTRIINLDQVTSAPLTLQLDGVSESQALAVLLRSVNGYVAAPRAERQPDASRFDRIMIMPGTSQPRVASMAPAPFTPPPAPAVVEQPIFQQAPDVENPDAERPVRTVPPPASRGPVFGVFPRPQAEPAAAPARPMTPSPTTPRPTSPATGTPAAGTPAGVAVPGMLVPAPPTGQEPSPQNR
jgi:hypothetical protein